MAIIFDGNDYATKKKLLLQVSSDRVRELGVIPHLATILIGDNPGSAKYSELKRKYIESLGCQVDIYKLPASVKFEEIELLVNTLNNDATVHGIMLQMPLPEQIKEYRLKIIDLISKNKDIDGLRDDSDYLHPTSKAILEVLALAIHDTKIDIKSVCVVGATGMVGKPLVKELNKLKFNVIEADINTTDLNLKTIDADCVVSATGVMNLITTDMVKDEATLIDVGYPEGDISPMVSEKASFVTPVPGGVGPVTITCLAENLILASSSTITSSRDANSQES